MALSHNRECQCEGRAEALEALSAALQQLLRQEQRSVERDGLRTPAGKLADVI